jgi:hypothetical protein
MSLVALCFDLVELGEFYCGVLFFLFFFLEFWGEIGNGQATEYQIRDLSLAIVVERGRWVMRNSLEN